MATKVKSYKDLLVWQKAMILVEEVYKSTKKLPPSEQWGLVSQIRRASVSIPSNIAEGYGRYSSGQYHHYLSISLGSLLEVETQILLSKRLGFLSGDDIVGLLNQIKELNKMLVSLISKIRQKV